MFFRDVIGQKTLVKRLIRQTSDNRISHAQLFLGTADTGALPLAVAYARFIHCTGRQTDDACGKCLSCIKYDKLGHPDIHHFFPSAPNDEFKKDVSSKLFTDKWRSLILENPYFTYYQWLRKLGVENKQAIISAEDCNDIIRQLGRKSFESPYRIVLVYMIEKLFHSAAPKLLKVLEEPPPNTVFLLVSENKDRILNTILSRTQIIKMPFPQEQEVLDALIHKYGLPADKAKQISFLSGGSITEALRLSRQDEEHMADFESFREWMRHCFRNDAAKILKWVEITSKGGREKQKSFLLYGLKVFRMCMLSNYKLHSLVRLEGEEHKFIQGFAPFVNHKNTLQIVGAFNEAITHLERNANPRILFTDLSFDVVRLLHVKT